MINYFLGLFAHDIGIDLGTANTLVYVRGRGIIINEPSVVAINTKNNQILAIGNEAKKMVGKTPSSIIASKPLINGVVSDFEITEQMLRYFVEKTHREKLNFSIRPRIVIGIPSGVTEVEKRAVENAANNAGARQTLLVEEPMAAAIGSRLSIHDAAGSMIVDIGGGTTEVAVISLGGIVVSKSLRIAGDDLTESIIKYARDEFNLQVGERTAENIKIAIGTAFPLQKDREVPMRGRDLATGLPKEVIVNSDQVRDALQKNINSIIDIIKLAIEETPPELLADIMDRGIVLSGGGALLRGLDLLIHQEVKIPVHVTDDPLTAVVRGTGLILEDLDSLKDILVYTKYTKLPKV